MRNKKPRYQIFWNNLDQVRSRPYYC